MTAWRMATSGTLPGATLTPAGRWVVEVDLPDEQKQVVAYVRVSAHDQKADLDRQAGRCEEFCRSRGWEVSKVIKEVASGMNDARPKLLKLLDARPQRIVVEHKDR